MVGNRNQTPYRYCNLCSNPDHRSVKIHPPQNRLGAFVARIDSIFIAQRSLPIGMLLRYRGYGPTEFVAPTEFRRLAHSSLLTHGTGSGAGSSSTGTASARMEANRKRLADASR